MDQHRVLIGVGRLERSGYLGRSLDLGGPVGPRGIVSEDLPLLFLREAGHEVLSPRHDIIKVFCHGVFFCCSVRKFSFFLS